MSAENLPKIAQQVQAATRNQFSAGLKSDRNFPDEAK